MAEQAPEKLQRVHLAALELYDFAHAVYGYLQTTSDILPDSGLTQRCEDILDWIEEGENRITKTTTTRSEKYDE